MILLRGELDHLVTDAPKLRGKHRHVSGRRQKQRSVNGEA